MKHLKYLLPLFLILSACKKDFSEILSKAETNYAEKNYVETIDTLTNGMSAWKESDGSETKGRAYELLGLSYHQLRNTDKAIESYEHAIQLSNKTYTSAHALGNIFLAKSQPDHARKCFEDALRMKPDDPLALLGLGNSLFGQKKYSEASRTFEKVLDVSPGVREAQESLHALKSHSSRKARTTPAKKQTPTRKKSQPKKRR